MPLSYREPPSALLSPAHSCHFFAAYSFPMASLFRVRCGPVSSYSHISVHLLGSRAAGYSCFRRSRPRLDPSQHCRQRRSRSSQEQNRSRLPRYGSYRDGFAGVGASWLLARIFVVRWNAGLEVRDFGSGVAVGAVAEAVLSSSRWVTSAGGHARLDHKAWVIGVRKLSALLHV